MGAVQFEEVEACGVGPAGAAPTNSRSISAGCAAGDTGAAVVIEVSE